MENCVFCDFSKIQANTLASIRGLNITATLGQITDGGYLLIMPMNHVACLGAMDKDQLATFKQVTTEVKLAIQEEYKTGVTIFEHGIIGQTIPHAHLHLLPANIDITERIETDFPESKIEIVTGFNKLRLLYSLKRTPYLFWSDPAGYFRVCWNPPAPKMYLRLIASEMLGVLERGNWQTMNPDLDKKLREETLERLTPYFLP